MGVYFTWGAIGVLLLFLIIGFVAGLIRGLKRSSLHILFLLVSVVLAYFITKPITSAVLKFTIEYEGNLMPISDIIVKMVSEVFDLTSFSGATAFASSLPMAIASPILFIVLTALVYLLLDIIYLIVARISFGKKKKDFETNKPRRAYGAIIGMVEGFILLFVMFAPITSLTHTYAEIVNNSSPAQSASVDTDGSSSTDKMKTLGQTVSEMLPPAVNEAIFAYNNSVIGKIAGAGGLDNALFDGLSSFNIDEQKINFRKEVITLAKVYDEVAVTYNAISDQDFENIDLTTLKAELETFLNNGIFKAVITDIINTIVVEFEELKQEIDLSILPEVVQDIITDLNEKFTSDNFDAYEYIKSDILNLVNIFDEIIKSDLIPAFTNATEGINGTLEVVSENSEKIMEISQDILGLNMVGDTFNAIGKFASQMLAEAFVNDKGLEIGLNIDIQNKDEILQELFDLVEDINTLNQEVKIFDILNSESMSDAIIEIEDIETSLAKVGKLLDDVRNLSILVLPVEDGVRTEKEYVFDNILETLNIKLLGDVVYTQTSTPSSQTLDTYEKFFTYIGKPLEAMKDMGLFEEVADFNELLNNNILPALETNKAILADLLVPFYQLKTASFDTTNVDAPNVKAMIFDTFVEMIGSSVTVLDMNAVETEAENADTTTAGSGVTVWERELTKVGELLTLLDKGEIEVDTAEGKINVTYIQYMLSADADFVKLLTAVLNDTDETLFENVIDKLFSATIFETLKTQVFEEIDGVIETVTGVAPETDLTKLDETKEQTIETIKELFKLITADDVDLTALDLKTAGKILNILKENAYNGSAKDGVFNNIFSNLVWYMTGDNLTGADYTGKTPYEQTTGAKTYEDIKAYLNVASSDEYYTINYEQKFAELEQVVIFSETLMTTLAGKTLDTPQNIAIYLESAKSVIDAQISATSRDETLTVINNTAQFLLNKGENLLDGESTDTKQTVKAGIESTYSSDTEMATALKKLMQVDSL